MVRTLVGIEVTEESVRAVEISTHRSPAFLRGGAVPLPAGAAKDSEVIDPDAVALAVRQLWGRAGIATRDVHLGIGNRRILVREYTTKAMRPDLLRQALPFQVQDLLPVPASQAVLDFYPVAQHGDDVTGLLVAAVSETVEQLIATLARAKLRVQTVDLVPFGLARVARAIAPPGTTAAMIHIADHTTYVTIAEGGVPRFVRIIPVDIATGVVRMRREEGLAVDADGETESDAAPRSRRSAQPRAAARPGEPEADPAVDDLVARLRNTVAFYANRPGALPVSSAFVSGAGAAAPGVMPALVAGLGVEAKTVTASDLLTARGAELPGGDLALDLVSTTGLVLGAAS